MPQPKYQSVSLLRRLAAILYDFVLLATLLFLASFAVVIPLKIYPEHPLFIVYQGYLFMLSFLFFAWFWTHGGQTLGMKSWKFKVTRVDGSELNWKTAWVRFLIAIVSWMPCGLGYFWAAFDPENRTWHDMASGSRLTRT
ncbi:MAG: RDD family protein [Gammaproteobacteria bacterium]|nr:RDD family protein [Gammaproteobacteria bacterium]